MSCHLRVSNECRSERGRRPARPSVSDGLALVVLVLLMSCAGPALAAEEEKRTTGLPAESHWTFNFDAGLGYFPFGTSLYTNARPDPSGDLSANWAESFAKPAISASFDVGKSQIYGKLSGVGERTFFAPPPLVGEEASSFQVEDAYVGWRSGTLLGKSENLLDFTVG